MDKPRRKIRVVGQRRDEVDVERFAEAIIAFALHHVRAESEPTDESDGNQSEDEEWSA